MIKDTAKTLDETVAARKTRIIQTNGGRYERGGSMTAEVIKKAESV